MDNWINAIIDHLAFWGAHMVLLCLYAIVIQAVIQTEQNCANLKGHKLLFSQNCYNLRYKSTVYGMLWSQCTIYCHPLAYGYGLLLRPSVVIYG